jgi:hypothetical protein
MAAGLNISPVIARAYFLISIVKSIPYDEPPLVQVPEEKELAVRHQNL